MKQDKLISMVAYVNHIRGLTTSELISKYPKTFPPLRDSTKEGPVKWMLQLDAIKWMITGEYMKFLSRKLKLGMFVPCDLEGNVLEKPKDATQFLHGIEYDLVTAKKEYSKQLKEYQQAESRVLFEVDGSYDLLGDIYDSMGKNTELEDLNIEDIVNIIGYYEITLTKSAKELIGWE